MLSYLLLSSLAALVSLLVAKLVSQSKEIKGLKDEKSRQETAIEGLSSTKLQNLEKIQHLTTKLEMTQSNFEALDKAQQSAMQAAEKTLKSLGADLTKQLLLAHQHENKNSQIQYDQKVTRTAQEIKTEIQKLLSSINVLEKEVEKSSCSVESIKKSILSPVQGNNLTEITLSNVLNTCGLKSDLDFKLQYTMNKAGRQYRPDAVVFLPNSQFILIDAKASKFFLESDQGELGESLLRSMYRHLKDLSEKGYETALIEHLNIDTKGNYKVSTLMFLNTESMVEKISSLDPNFLKSAWLKNIFPVGPTGLMNMLSIAKHHILETKQTENYKAILSETKHLLTAVDTLATHGQKLGNSIQSLVASYDKFSGSFNRHFIARAKNLSKLGMKNSSECCIQLRRYELVSQEVVDKALLAQSASDLEPTEEGENSKCKSLKPL